jgi:hypothetical protein
VDKKRSRIIVSVVAVTLLALAFSLRSKPKAVDLKDGIGSGNGQSGGSFARVVRPIVISRNVDASVGADAPESNVSNVEGQEGDAPKPVPQGDGIKKKTEKIKIDQSTLDQIASGNDRVVQVSLFDGEVVNVGIDRRTPNGPKGAILVYGKVMGDPASRVYFSVYKHAMFATLRLGDGRKFTIESLPQGKDRFELVEVNTSASLRHQKIPGVPEPEMFHMINGQKVRILRCYTSSTPKSPYPPRRMLGSDMWRPEVKVIAMEPGVADRVKLRMPLGGTGTSSTENSEVPRPPIHAAGRVVRGTGGNGTSKESAAANNTTAARVPVGRLPTPTGAQQQQGSQQQGSQQQQQGGGGGPEMLVGIIYTPRAETLLGDAAKVQAKAGTLFAGMNTALADSGTGASVKQAGSAFKISKDFDGKQKAEMDACLVWMQNDKESTDWRDANKADLVTCIVEGDPSGIGSCGLGYVLPTKAGAKDSGYNCMWHSVGDVTFSHECGHNMGLGHDETENGGQDKGIDAWSWGNHFTAESKGYSTIQAYTTQSFPNDALIYSSPNVKYKNTVTGVADKTDAVRTIKETSGPVSKYY